MLMQFRVQQCFAIEGFPKYGFILKKQLRLHAYHEKVGRRVWKNPTQKRKIPQGSQLTMC